MLKSKRTLRIPVQPVNAEFIGTAFEGLDSLSKIHTQCASDISDLIRLRNDGMDLSGPITSGVVSFVHPRGGTLTWTGFDAFNGEPDITHFEAALKEYATWIDYWDILGWIMAAPVTSGTFGWLNPNGVAVAGTPVFHDLWVDDTGEGWAESMNVIVAPSATTPN